MDVGRSHQRGRTIGDTWLRLLPCSRWKGRRQEHIPEGLTARLPALYQMLATRRRFVGFWPKVRDPRNQPVREDEERHPIVNAVIKAPFEPHHSVMLVSNHDLGPQMPITRVVLI